MIQLFNPETDGWLSNAPETVLVGPPGTGKTRNVLNSWLIPALRDTEPKNILACSFTKAAAVEMRDRLSGETNLDELTLRRTCSTIHSEAYRLIRINGGASAIWKESSRKPGRKPGQAEPTAEEEDIEDPWENLGRQRSELREEAERIWSVMRHKWPEDLPLPMDPDDARLIHSVSRALTFTDSQYRPDEIAAEIRAYEADKRSVGEIDFCDMLINALPYQPEWRELILVDEAQDLSPLQIMIIEQWARQARSLAWIGDPDQGIYRFSGADGEHLTGLMRREDIVVRSLQKSYRVPGIAHAMARGVILRNRLRVDAPYSPTDDPGELHRLRSPEHAAAFAEDHADPDHGVFILSRTAKGLAPYAQSLELAGVPFANERGASPLKNRQAVLTVTCLADIFEHRLVGKDQLLALVKSIPGRPRSSFFSGTKKAAEEAVKAMDDGQHIRPHDLDSVGLSPYEIASAGSLQAALEAMRKLEAYTPILRILERSGAASLRREPSITLTTMHASKGREAYTVIVDLHAPYPVRKTLTSGVPEEVEAERRVAYVALTRTLHTLALVDGELSYLLDAAL